MSRSSSPLQSKVMNVLAVLHEHSYEIQATGRRVRPPSQSVLVGMINEWRDVRKISARMHSPNLSSFLRNADQATPTSRQLDEITNALGLCDLGFDESIWLEDEQEILGQVKAALEGGVLATVTSYPVDEGLLQLQAAEMGKGIVFDTMPKQLFAVREFAIVDGQRISVSTNMHSEGYLQLMAFQNGEYIGLNDYLEIPAQSMQAGGRVWRKTLETSALVPRAYVFAFAATEPVFGKWPKGHAKKERLETSEFLKLVRLFFNGQGYERMSSVQSFITAAAG